MCYYCGKAGHVIYDCRIKRRDESRVTSTSGASSNGKSEGLVFHNKSVLTRSPVVDEVTYQFSPKSDDVRDEYRPFVSDGSVSFVDCTSNRVPIKILRDTGTTQSLILEKVLPFCSSSATGECVIVQGIEDCFVNIPLHRVRFVSDLVSGSTVVGVASSLPMKGVSLLLGNDLAGGKVIPK